MINSKIFAKWVKDGSLWQAFIASVRHLAAEQHLDLRILYGDGIGYSGYKHQKGEKVIAITDNHGAVLEPVPVAPVNATDMVLLPQGLKALQQVANR